MKRAHRTAHWLIWVLMPGILLVIIGASLAIRAEPAVNHALPAALIEEAG